jgi:hypothetical protein
MADYVLTSYFYKNLFYLQLSQYVITAFQHLITRLHRLSIAMLLIQFCFSKFQRNVCTKKDVQRLTKAHPFQETQSLCLCMIHKFKVNL